MVGPATEKDSMELVPDWTKADIDGLKDTFDRMDWDVALEGKSGLEAWEFFRQFMDDETEKHVPKKLRRVGTKPLWMNKNILRLIRKKRRSWKWYTRDGGKDYESFQAYKKVQREVQKGVKRAKRNSERKLAKNR